MGPGLGESPGQYADCWVPGTGYMEFKNSTMRSHPAYVYKGKNYAACTKASFGKVYTEPADNLVWFLCLGDYSIVLRTCDFPSMLHRPVPKQCGFAVYSSQWEFARREGHVLPTQTWVSKLS